LIKEELLNKNKAGAMAENDCTFFSSRTDKSKEWAKETRV
jgi:hypothetical protein